MRYSAITSTALLLLGSRTLCTPTGQIAQDTIYNFDQIKPSANLSWTSCYEDFTCARLEVPLDYADPSIGTTAIAFIKLAGSNATASSPSILVLPGGPGGSGIQTLLLIAPAAQALLGSEYNIVSFDPRGVNNSGPSLNCFGTNTEARQAFYRLHNTGVTNASSSSLEEQYYSSTIYGDWCNHAAETEYPHGFYVTTPASARDLLSFIEAEARFLNQDPSAAKLWAYGASYGTVTGQTFATLFPDRVERMILDGLVDADLYYRNEYTANLAQMDQAMYQFASLCHSAGPSKCSFYGPSPQNITDRLDAIITELKNQPVPQSDVQTQSEPVMITYADLKALFLYTVYTPILQFPVMADILHQIEQGNVSALAGMYNSEVNIEDANIVIGCADSYRTNSITSFEDFRNYAEYAAQTSKYIGDIYPIYVNTVLCRTMRSNLPDSMVIKNASVGTDHSTPFPILFASNTIDPITPLISAQKSSARFPGSILLLQEGIGHTIIDQGPTDCYIKHVQAYFNGIVPPQNTTCAAQYIPFINTPSL